jgi:hypothetical protein
MNIVSYFCFKNLFNKTKIIKKSFLTKADYVSDDGFLAKKIIGPKKTIHIVRNPITGLYEPSYDFNLNLDLDNAENVPKILAIENFKAVSIVLLFYFYIIYLLNIFKTI